MHTLQMQIFWIISPFDIAAVKKAHKARTHWYGCSFCLIYQYQILNHSEKGMDRNNKKTLFFFF